MSLGFVAMPCCPTPLLLPLCRGCASAEYEDSGAVGPGQVTLQQIAEEDANGVAVLEGQVVTTTGIATVASGVLGVRKLRI